MEGGKPVRCWLMASFMRFFSSIFCARKETLQGGTTVIRRAVKDEQETRVANTCAKQVTANTATSDPGQAPGVPCKKSFQEHKQIEQ